MFDRYIDDAESALYLMICQASSEASLEESLEELSMKEIFWSSGMWDVSRLWAPGRQPLDVDALLVSLCR